MIGKVQYGAVVLDLVKVNDVIRRPIYSEDGIDYETTETTIDLTCVLNPECTSFHSLNVNGVPVDGVAWAGRTDRVLQDYLSTPRRTLKMWSLDADGSEVVYLQTPPPGGGAHFGPIASDTRGGPFCRVFSITGNDVHGGKTWFLHLRFVAYVNNCFDKTSPILTHRWNSNLDYDKQFRAIRVIRGRVVFNLGRLRQTGQSPDMYRAQFFQPPPLNFKREHVSIEVESDGCTANYTVVDTEQFYSLGANSAAVEVQASLTTWYDQGSVMSALARTAPTLWETGRSLLNPGLSLGDRLNMSYKPYVKFSGELMSELPRYYANIKVKAIGARNSSRKDLKDLCCAIAFSRLGNPNFFSFANRSEMIVSQVLHDNIVELDFTLRWMDQMWAQLAGALGPLGTIGVGAGLVITNDNGIRFLDSFFTPPTVDNNPLGNDTNTRPPGTGIDVLPGAPAAPIPANTTPLLSQKPIGNRPMNTTPDSPDKDARGVGYLKFLLAQGLMGQCEIPPVRWDIDSGTSTVPRVDVPFMPPA